MYHDLYVYRQTGKLIALGLSFCVEIIPELSAGITLNHTKWQDYVYITRDNNNKQIRPITGYPVEESDINPTNQIKIFS